MKWFKKILKTVLYTILALLLLANLFIILSGRFYLYKGISQTYFKGRSGPSIYDRDIFAYSTIKKSDSIFVWKSGKHKIPLNQNEEHFMQSVKSSSFLVFKGEELIHESYWNGHDKNTVSNSFSAAKTFVSLLIGIAWQEGKIKSLDDKAGDYLESFKEKGKDRITIRHLLLMSSGLDWRESGKNPLSENAASYYGTDLYNLVTRQKSIEVPGKRFNYQSGNSQLLAYILEKATGQDLSAYAYDKIWSKIGTEHDAYWSLDTEKGDEKAFCCLYGTSRDFGRLGKLIEQNGVWNGKQIISEAYMKQLFENPSMSTDEGVPNYRYGLHIWTYLGGASPVYYCRGILGQYIISIPAEDLVIVRTGMARKPTVEADKNKYRIGHPSDLFAYISTAKRIAKTVNK